MEELIKLLNIDESNINKYKIRYLKRSTDGVEPYDVLINDKYKILDWLSWKYGKVDILGNCEKVIGLVRNYKKSKDSWIYIGTYDVKRKENFFNINDAPAYDLTILPDNYVNNLEIEYHLPNNQTSIEMLYNVLNNKENKMKIVDNNIDINNVNGNYTWIPIFEELASKLLEFKNNRKELLDIFYDFLDKEGKLGVSDGKNCNMLNDKNGKKVRFNDIDPFTFMNRLAMYCETDNTFRIKFLTHLKGALKLKNEIPSGFDGIPSVNYLSSWFFPQPYNQKGDEFENLWNLFEKALLYADSKITDKEFIDAFNKINPGVAMTCALYRARPSFYVSLDSNSATALKKEYGIKILDNKFTGDQYIDYMKQIKKIIKNNNYKNNADFSYKSWLKYRKSENDRDREKDKDNIIKINDSVSGQNVIFYGVPGCGKSHLVNKKAKEYHHVFRTVFHPDYTYTDFIGQVMPIVVNKKDIIYKIVPGPFTKALAEAYNDTNRKVLLIIEEINRGNAAAIFGDIFQLLDRDIKDNPYSINNELICSYLRKYTKNKFNSNEFNLPNNLDIMATMNTSDQNVYTLDTAFRRRFSFVRVKNDFVGSYDQNEKEYIEKLRKTIIAGLNIQWEDFVKTINDYIIEKNELLLNNEDKRLGIFSVSIDDLNNESNFADKVLFYLWDNIGKYNPDKFFRDDKDTHYKVYDQLIDDYLSGKGIRIFCEDLELLLNTKINIEKDK